ncbi:MAG: serine/threonine protein kinase [Myxococcales bacterium]|nr:serine/threonine protein kinase [Myxococcales bacterium]
MGDGSNAVDDVDDADDGGHETLLPSITLSILSRGDSSPQHLLDPGALGLAAPVAALTAAPSDTTERIRGARVGDVIGGRYAVEAQLGRGGMGRVLRARHQALGKAFALKLIKTPIAMDPRIREMFYREARLASACSHDNICSIVDFGEDPQFGLFMVMELLDGQTMHSKLRQGGRLAPKVACDVMWQVCEALRYIHGRAIIHGDIKTENIFLVRGAAQRRVAKLLDFGLSRPDRASAGGQVDGTPEYLAPERISGGPATVASDIYALGIVLFELLTARLPFSGTLDEVFEHQLKDTIPAPSTLVDGEALDERADEIVAKATAKNPLERHADVAGFMYELRTLMNMLGMETQRRRAGNTDATRERREADHRTKAAYEVFIAAPIPMAAVDVTGKVRIANQAFLEFLGCAGDVGGIDLRDSGMLEVYPTLLRDLAAAIARRATVKRVIYLSEGGGATVEVAVLITPAATSAEVTAGELHLALHPLRHV